MAVWIGRYFQWHVAESYPLNFVWPISTVCAAIILDWLLMKTKSFILTSPIRANGFPGMGFNYIPLALFCSPLISWATRRPSPMCKVSSTSILHMPEYLRHIERGALGAASSGRSIRFAGVWRTLSCARLLDRPVHRPLSRCMADTAIYQNGLRLTSMHSNGLPWYRRIIPPGTGIAACLLVTASTASAHGGMAGPDELGPPLFTSAALAFVCYWAVILANLEAASSDDAPDGRRRPVDEGSAAPNAIA